MIGEPTFADAILDRIVHNVYRFALEGRPTSRQIREPGLRLPRERCFRGRLVHARH